MRISSPEMRKQMPYFCRVFGIVLLLMSFCQVSLAEDSPKKEGEILETLGPHAVVGDEATGFASRALGLRGQVSVFPSDPLEGGAAAEVRSIALLFGPIVSAFYTDRLWIGGGSSGVTYSLAAQVAVGVRKEFEGNHGPFARIEVRGELKRTGGWYQSSLRAPGLELGWGMDHDDWILESFAHGGPSLSGSLKTPDDKRALRGLFMGGALSVGFRNVFLHSDASHLFKNNLGDGLWDLRSSLCSYFGPTPTKDTRTGAPSRSVGPRSIDYRWGLCVDSATLSTLGTGRFSEKTDIGLSILIGAFSRVDRSSHL